MTKILIYLIPIAFLIFCLFKVKYNRGGFYSDNLSVENTNVMKGIFCIAIVLCHLAENPTVDNFYFFLGTGNLSVSIFLFLSGYGLMCSYLKNGLNKFFKKRFSAVFVPFIFAEILYYLYCSIVPGIDGLTDKTFSVKALIHNFFHGGMTLIINGWFVFEIILLYIIFFIAFKLFGKTKKRGVFACFILVFLTEIFFAVLCFKTDWIQFWAYSTLAFAYGVIWSAYKDKIESFIKAHYFPILVFSIFFTCLFFFSNRIFDTFFFDECDSLGINTTFLSRYLTSPFFVLTVAVVSLKFKCKENRLFAFLGNISYEIYLLHGFVYSVLRTLENIENDFIYVVITLFLTVDAAYILNYIVLQVKTQPSKIFNKFKQRKLEG